MNKIEEKSLIVKAADVKVNTDAISTKDGSFMLESLLSNTIEGSSIYKNDKYIELNKEIVNTNHFLLMLQIAFNEHKPICISPDDIWLLVCQGFSEHMKLNSESFKDLLGLDEKQIIQVRRDDFVLGGYNPWEEIFPEFTRKIEQTIKEDLYSGVVLDFSTSTEKEINAFEIAFMDSMSNYFDYEFISLCGIPEIEIKGTIDDYNKIITSLEELKKYDLDWWIEKLIPIIENFIHSLNGQNNFDFWSSIYKEKNESGGPYITGWIANFFPYLKSKISEKNGIIDFSEYSISESEILKTLEIEDLNFDNLKIHKILVKNPKLLGMNKRKVKLDDFPSGLSTVPFKWKYMNTEIDMNFVSGFIGIKESELNHALSTDINWIVNRK